MPDELVVRRAGFAPVKGMRHLALDAVDLDARGAVGDRAWCVVDVDRSRVLRTVQHPSLIGVVARPEVETDEPFVEDTWLGQEVGVVDARLRIGGPIPRCAVIDHHPGTGEKDLRLLNALVRERPTNRAGEPMLGVYATCVEPGRVTVTR